MILGSNLELTSHAVLYYLWSADLSKSFPNSLRQYLSIFNIFSRDFTRWKKSVGLPTHCMKSVQIRSYFWSAFSCIWTEYGDLRSKSLYSVRVQENTDQK